MIGAALICLGAAWSLWGFYVLIMGLYRAHLAKRLSRPAYLLALPFLVVGYVVDALVNIMIASVVFLELPRSLLLTDRLEYHLGRDGWRGSLARWICTQLLDVFDPTGTHCKPIFRSPHAGP